MIITWIQYPLAFSSRPIQRTVSLYWDNLKDGYVIVPHTNGGSYIAMINAKYEAKVENRLIRKTGISVCGLVQRGGPENRLSVPG